MKGGRALHHPILHTFADEPGGQRPGRYALNSIALGSNCETEPIIARTDDWVGDHLPDPDITDSGLWNIEHIDVKYDPDGLDRVQSLIEDS